MAGGESLEARANKFPPPDEESAAEETKPIVDGEKSESPSPGGGPHQSANWGDTKEGGASVQRATEYELKPGADPFLATGEETRIIRRLSAGDEEALGTLMDRYGGALLHFAHRLVGDMQMAEEICQDTMLKAWQQAGSFRMDGHLKAWLFRVARNNAIDYIRRKRLPIEEYQTASETAATDQQPEVEAEKTWLTEAILDALEILPPQYRDVIEMRFFQDMGYQEIAAILKIPLGTVKSRLNYALKGLTRVLIERGIGPDLIEP